MAKRELHFERSVRAYDGVLVATSRAHNEEGQFLITKRICRDRGSDSYTFDQVECLLRRVKDTEQFYKDGGGEPQHCNPALVRRKFANRAETSATFAFAQSQGLSVAEIAAKYGYSETMVRVYLKRRDKEIAGSLSS